MRIVVLSALLASSVSLAACGGGGMDSISNGGVLSGASAACLPSIDSSINVGNIGAQPTDCPAPTPSTTPPQSSNGQNLPPVNTVNTGNTTSLTASNSDVTLALENNVLIHAKNAPAKSRLTIVNGTTEETKTAKFEIDTGTDRNGTWPIPKDQKWDKHGTQNYYDTSLNNNGNEIPAALDPTAPDIELASALHLGGKYNEYRAITKTGTNKYDEELQVWTFNNSYAAQYRHVDGKQQAWSFGAANGGAKTNRSDMPAGGTVSMTGEYTTTAKTENWMERIPGDPLRTMDINNIWSTNGVAATTIDFSKSTNNVVTVLDPRFWRTFQVSSTINGWGYVDVQQAEADIACTRLRTCPVLSVERQRNMSNFKGFMPDKIILNGTLSTPADVAATPTTPAVPSAGNSIIGSASFYRGTVADPDGASSLITSSANPFYGALFGTSGAMEMTGVFALDGTDVQPIGGNTGINDDRRATVSHSGIVHTQQ